MKGKILGEGAISGSDGKRYTYQNSDVANLGERNPKQLTGCEVDFEVDGEGKAKAIYITNQPFGIDAKNLVSTELPSIKLKAFIALGLHVAGCIFMLIPVVGVFFGCIFGLASIILMLLMVLGIRNTSGSKSILLNWILMKCIAVVGWIILAISVGGAVMGMIFSGFGGGGSIGTLGIIGCVFGVIIALSAFYFMWQFYKELAFITNEQMFLYAFYCYLAGAITMVIFIGFLFYIAGFVLYVIAWVQTKELQKSYNAG